jgi:hypothetical protein
VRPEETPHAAGTTPEGTEAGLALAIEEMVLNGRKPPLTDCCGVRSSLNIIEARVRAVRTGNVDAMIADVADDVVTFDPSTHCGAGEKTHRRRAPRNGLRHAMVQSALRLATYASRRTATWPLATRSVT